MEQIHLERLMMIVNHLEGSKLGHKRFDFGVVHVGRPNPSTGHCGTLGCAMGELPIIFPQDFKFASNFVVGRSCTIDNWVDGVENIKEFLGLDSREFKALFFPDSQWQAYIIDLKPLSRYASKEAVADNIRTFIKYKAQKCGLINCKEDEQPTNRAAE